MVSVNKSKRVAGQDVVDQPPIYLPEGHPDIELFDPKKIVIVKGGAPVYDKYTSLDTPFDPQRYTEPDVQGDEKSDQIDDIDLDKFDLTSIEEIMTPVKKYDPVTGAITYWITLKIRNTSISPDNVKGVDARVYVPGS